MSEGWSSAERDVIKKTFQDGYGRTSKSGTPLGMEVPMRVLAIDGGKAADGTRIPKYVYVYENDLSAADRKTVRDLEIKARGVGESEAKEIENKIKEIFTKGNDGKPYYVERSPLTNGEGGTPDQEYILNNTQAMVASDAANVGLNWPTNYLCMYDSLFSPMDEWQRITRAARMMDPLVSPELKPIMDKLKVHMADVLSEKGSTHIDSPAGANAEEKLMTSTLNAMEVVDEAVTRLNVFDQAALSGEAGKDATPGGSSIQLVEAYYASQAFGKLDSLYKDVGDKLRREGTEDADGKFIQPEEIVQSDIVNKIVRDHMTDFERSMLKARRALVDVKRLTTSAEIPLFTEEKRKNPLTGKKETVKVPVLDAHGNHLTETQSPVEAERAQLASQRSKMAPYELFLHVVQSSQPLGSEYDYIVGQSGTLASFSHLEDDMPAIRAGADEKLDKVLGHRTGTAKPHNPPGATGLSTRTKKSFVLSADLIKATTSRPRFYVRLPHGR
jgi:hypothetical protein